MKARYRFYILAHLVLLSGLSVSVSYAAERVADKTVITIAAEDSWPPFSDQQGEGISKRIAQAAFRYSGYEIETRVMPYARALHMTELAKVDACWNVTRQANTGAIYHFGNEVLLQATISFYYRADNPLNYQQISDIPENTEVGVILGYEYGDDYEHYKSRLQPQPVSTQANLLKMLLAKRMDVVLMFDKVFETTIATNGFDRDDFVQGATFYTSDIYIAFAPNSPDSVTYSQALDKGLRYLRETGEYERLFQSTSSQ